MTNATQIAQIEENGTGKIESTGTGKIESTGTGAIESTGTGKRLGALAAALAGMLIGTASIADTYRTELGIINVDRGEQIVSTSWQFKTEDGPVLLVGSAPVANGYANLTLYSFGTVSMGALDDVDNDGTGGKVDNDGTGGTGGTSLGDGATLEPWGSLELVFDGTQTVGMATPFDTSYVVLDDVDNDGTGGKGASYQIGSQSGSANTGEDVAAGQLELVIGDIHLIGELLVDNDGTGGESNDGTDTDANPNLDQLRTMSQYLDLYR